MMRVQLSGKVEVTVRGAPVDLGSAKPQAVLASLALGRGDLVSVDRLIALVWGDDPPRTAEKTLQSYMTRLRKVCGDGAIERVGEAYKLNVDPEHVDLVAFEVLLDQGDTVAAVELWQGEPLAGIVASPALAAAVLPLVERYSAAVEQLLGADQRSAGVGFPAAVKSESECVRRRLSYPDLAAVDYRVK